MENPILNINVDNFGLPTLSSLLTDSENSVLNLSSNLVEYAKRDTIIKQGARSSHVLFINQGLIKISKEVRKGKSLMLTLEGSNTFIGVSTALGGDTYNYSVTAIEPTVVCFIDTKVIKDIIRNNGALGLEFIIQISQNDNTMIEKLSSLLYKQLPGRVADIIIYFSEHIYKNDTFTFPLTRQELAELAGTTKESIIRTLSEFKHDKIIDIERNTVSVLSPKIIHTLSRLG
jgi:CRP-like cAMP-binding protein